MSEPKGCEHDGDKLDEFIQDVAVASAKLTFDKSGHAETTRATDTEYRLDISPGIGAVALGSPQLQILNGDTQHAIS